MSPIPAFSRSKVTSIDVNLRGLRTLRVSLVRDPAGEPETLMMATGFADPWQADTARPVVLPAAAIPELRRALEALEASR